MTGLKLSALNQIKVLILFYTNLGFIYSLFLLFSKPEACSTPCPRYGNRLIHSLFHNLFMQLLTVISTIDDLNYPEKTDTYYIVNAPYIFSACWKVCISVF